MGRLIDAIGLKQALVVSAILEDKKTIEQIIDEQPTIEPERKTGHWVYRPEWSKYGDVWSCSECGEKTSQSVMGEPRFKYCPMCGADMRGNKHETD